MFERLEQFVKGQLKQRFGYVTPADREKAWHAARRAQNDAMRQRMKPSDGTRGFMFDTDKPQGVVVALNKEKLLEVYRNPKKDRPDTISRDQVRWCSRAFRENNNTHLMITLYVTPEGEVHLMEGNHRLELLRQGSENTILANVVNNSGYTDEEFGHSVVRLLEQCGQADAIIEQHPDVAYCNIDFDGHFVRMIEERVTAPYYTVTRDTGQAFRPNT